MVFELPKGKYIVAVSGGVDSVVLLDMLASSPQGSEFVVAHFDHGMRTDSKQDAEFVEQLAKKYDLEFITERAELGKSASEDQARVARYNFLRQAQKQHNAIAIITAHHQDDLLETMMLHVQRGTGRAGLTPMNAHGVVRPLLYTSKKQILLYAQQHKLQWHEDHTNKNQKYARNKIRALLAANQNSAQQLLNIHKTMLPINATIEELLLDVYNYAVLDNQIIRARFVQLPYAAQCELIYMWLKKNGVQNVQKRLVQNAVIACKTYAPHKKMSLGKNADLLSQQKLIKILQK